VLGERVGRPALRRPAGGSFLQLADRAREQAAVQRRPRDDPDAVLDGGRYDLKLHVAGQQVVDALLADEPEEVAAVRRLLRRGQVPAGEVGRPDVAHLALRHQGLHRLPDLLPRRGTGDVVHLVQVDPVGLQPAE
jgi:hypothetical protein